LLLTQDSAEAISITVEQIRDHIGLTANVSPETRSEFIKRYVGYSLENWRSEYRREVQKDAATS